MQFRPATDDMIYPGMPAEKTLAQIRVWDEFLDPERHHAMHYASPGKVEDIIRVVRAVLVDEMHRHGSEYVAQNIWRDGALVNYAFEEAGFNNGRRTDERIGRRHYILFDNVQDAAFFEIFLHSVIRFGLTKFSLHNDWNTHDGNRPVVTVNHLGVVA